MIYFVSLIVGILILLMCICNQKIVQLRGYVKYTATVLRVGRSLKLRFVDLSGDSHTTMVHNIRLNSGINENDDIVIYYNNKKKKIYLHDRSVVESYTFYNILNTILGVFLISLGASYFLDIPNFKVLVVVYVCWLFMTIIHEILKEDGVV